MLDLSFTKDADWVADREKLWEPLEKSLRKNLRKKEVQDVRHFFFTGELLDTYKKGPSTFSYFPLQDKGGWDYVVENFFIDKGHYKHVMDWTLQGAYWGHEIASQQERWEYFFGKSFSETVESNVPVGKTSDKVIITLDVFRIHKIISVKLYSYITYGDYGEWPIWLKCINYYWSLWPYISDKCFEDNELGIKGYPANTVYFIKKLFKHVVFFQPEEEYPDPNQTRPKFLALLAEKMDEMYDDLCPRLQQLWDETKAKKAAKEAGQ